MGIHKISGALLLLIVSAIVLMPGCGGSSENGSSALLDTRNVNLIFVVSPDLANDPLGDINPATASLNDQGLQRSLLMGEYLDQRLLGGNSADEIIALEPMTHLQTANNYPDMAAIGFIQQFALLNRFTILGVTAWSYPIRTSYGSPQDVPAGVAAPVAYLSNCQGLVFDDASGNNLKLASGIIDAKVPGFYVFSAPWKTTIDLMKNIKAAMAYGIDLPAAYKGSNFVYAISVDPSGRAVLLIFDSRLKPPATYPVLPAPVFCAPCTQQNYFNISRTGGVNGAVIPSGINTNQTVYMIRHADAHPVRGWDDGNYIGTGQWRALALPYFLPGALRGLSAPTLVYSIDPAQSFPLTDDLGIPYVRPSLTVLPYAIANSIPYNLAASFLINKNPEDETAAENAMKFFFTSSAGVNLSDQTILLAWEHAHFPLLIKHLLDSYGGSVPAPTLTWPSSDYDTIWTVTLDASGNVTVDNALCEGIDSASLPDGPPLF
jgi:hypothetical protein